MPLNEFSVLISPTYRCNADCEYCYQHKTTGVMGVNDFEVSLKKLTKYLREQDVTNLTLYWQGGEIFTMSPEWFLRAHDICREVSGNTELCITNRLQSNLIGYGPHWRRVVSEMFNNDVGSSLDFPNLYRKVAGGSPETFNDAWFSRFQEAREAGVNVGVIALLNNRSLSSGALEFYSYYVDKLGICSFQMNTPYPGGPPTPAKRNFPLDWRLLSSFYSELFDLWLRTGRQQGICISPFDQLVKYFRTGENRLSCIWSESCANVFIGIGPNGDVGQCESFVSSYPEYVFGNILACEDMADIMNSPVRMQFLDRPLRLMEGEDCAECEYLSLCHGGCPVRAFTATGNLFARDPYCESNKTLYGLARSAAVELDRLESTRRVENTEAVCA